MQCRQGECAWIQILSTLAASWRRVLFRWGNQTKSGECVSPKGEVKWTNCLLIGKGIQSDECASLRWNWKNKFHQKFHRGEQTLFHRNLMIGCIKTLNGFYKFWNFTSLFKQSKILNKCNSSSQTSQYFRIFFENFYFCKDLLIVKSNLNSTKKLTSLVLCFFSFIF